MKKTVLIILIIVLLGVFAFSAWKVIDILCEYRAGEQFYEEMNEFVLVPEAVKPTKPANTHKAESETAPKVEMETQPEEKTAPWPEVNFDALKNINNQVVGWIYIPGTNVNYPIVQGQDNDQYLYRLLTGEYNGSGSIFLDANVEADFSSPNSPIYGHNMNNGTMFADISKYRDQDYYDEHSMGMLVTPEENYYVYFFSGYVTDSWASAWKKTFSDGAFEKWLKEVEGKSCFTTDIVPTAQDEILTFSTCSYETDDARFVVHAVLRAEGK